MSRRRRGRTSSWLALVAIVVTCATAATTGGASVDRDQSADAARAASDPDRDGLSNATEARNRTNPRKRDTDGDSLGDGAEVRRYRTNPRKRDTDGDGFGDQVELRAGTNPRDGRSTPGFPGEHNTGVPPGTALSRYEGSATITRPNTVISGKTIGCIRVLAPGVVIRNSRISCAGPIAVQIDDGDVKGTRLLVVDSEIDCRNTPGAHAIAEANVTARRVDISACENGFDVNQNVTVEDSYIHDLYNGSDAHTDGIQLASRIVDGQIIQGVLNVTIRHNTIYGMGPDGSFGTSAIISNSGGDTNVLIENNLLAGGAYTLYCEQGAKGVNYRVLDNRFSRRFGPKVGFYGPAEDCADETQSGNVYHETGQPLTLR